MKSLADYVAAAKAAPGQLNYGSAGVGSNLHLAMELLKYRTGIQVTHVPYKGVGPAMQDLVAGHVMSMISNIPSSKPHIEKGTIRALAATSLKRSPALPDVPAMSDEGVTGYEVLNWFGVFAPMGTPKEIVDRLAVEARAMFDDPKTRDMLKGEGADPIASSPADFAAFVRAEIKKWDDVGKAANIQPTE
jgi:tripartite-type tricarboxylate transporter receptor subunit TctC